MKTTLRILLGAGLSLLVAFGSTRDAAAQIPQDLPLLFSGPVEVQTRVKPPRYTTVQHILAIDADGSIRPLTEGTVGGVRPSWSPDYRYIAFIRGGMLTVMEAKGEPNGARVFAVCPSWASGHDWAPDGLGIVFCSNSDLDPMGLWEVPVNPDTEEVGTPELIREGYCYEPSWSPDGTKIAFQLDGRVRILDLVNDTEISSSVSSATPAWNPVGDKLAYARVVTDIITKNKKTTTLNSYEICIANMDDGTATRVTRLQSFSAFPAWSPDGTQLVFRSDVDDKLGTSLYGTTIGSEEVTLLYAGGSFPNWAP